MYYSPFFYPLDSQKIGTFDSKNPSNLWKSGKFGKAMRFATSFW
jgi:hypothetical protein